MADESLLTKEVFESFQEESGELLDKWSSICLSLEQSLTRDDIDSLFRILHTLKGNAQCVGLNDYAHFVHRLEEVMYLIRDKKIEISSELISFFLSAQERLQAWTDEVVDQPGFTPPIEDLTSFIDSNYSKSIEKSKVKSKETVETQQKQIVINPSRKTILIVEDEIMVQSLLCATLQSHYNLVIANDGLQGLKKYYQYKNAINLIVTDIFMPKMDGIQMVKSILEKSQVPIIVMSGLMRERFGEIKGIKNIKTFPKPLETAQLILLITGILRK